jgi:murein DD-endopeptidase MepM/ murein hydrolase activator NlpD
MKSIHINNKVKLFAGAIMIVISLAVVLSAYTVASRAQQVEPKDNTLFDSKVYSNTSYTLLVAPDDSAKLTVDDSTTVELNKDDYGYTATSDGQLEDVNVPENVQKIIDNPESVKSDETVQNATSDFVDPLLNCSNYTFNRGFASYHTGVDLSGVGNNGTDCEVNSIGNGTVTKAEWGNNGEGYYVEIDHGNGIISIYHHSNGTFYVKPGDSVTAGQKIMVMGCTGFCTGNHVHLSILINGAYVNPEDLIVFKK